MATAIVGQASDEEAAWSFTVPGGTFADDDGDTLTLTDGLSDGTPLPAWLSFDATTGTFSGTPPQDYFGVIDLRVTASDGEESVDADFTLTIADLPEAGGPGGGGGGGAANDRRRVRAGPADERHHPDRERQ